MNIKKRFTKWYVKNGYKFGYDSSHVAVWHCPWWVKPLLIFFSPSVYFMICGKMFTDGFLRCLKNEMEAKEE